MKKNIAFLSMFCFMHLVCAKGTPAPVSSGSSVTAPAATDTVVSSVSLSSPANGATISSTISVSADASDNKGMPTVGSYGVSLNAANLTNGTRTLSAQGRDNAALSVNI